MMRELLLDFWITWQKSSKTERFGPYVYNRVDQLQKEPWPELSYEKDDSVAYGLLAQRFMTEV